MLNSILNVFNRVRVRPPGYLGNQINERLFKKVPFLCRNVRLPFKPLTICFKYKSWVGTTAFQSVDASAINSLLCFYLSFYPRSPHFLPHLRGSDTSAATFPPSLFLAWSSAKQRSSERRFPTPACVRLLFVMFAALVGGWGGVTYTTSALHSHTQWLLPIFPFVSDLLLPLFDFRWFQQS